MARSSVRFAQAEGYWSWLRCKRRSICDPFVVRPPELLAPVPSLSTNPGAPYSMSSRVFAWVFSLSPFSAMRSSC
eukprot:6478262-Amphidinium_carterae.2